MNHIDENFFHNCFQDLPIKTLIWKKIKDDFELIYFSKKREQFEKCFDKLSMGKRASKIFKDHSEILNYMNDCFKNKKEFSKKVKITNCLLKEQIYLVLSFNYSSPDKIIIQMQDITKNELEKQDLLEKISKLEKYEQELEIIFDNLPAVVFYKDVEGRHSLVNAYLANALNKEKKDILGKTSHELFPLEQADIMRRNDLRVMETGEKQLNLLEKWETPSGTRYGLTSKIPRKDKDGNTIGLIGFSLDITDHIKAEQKLRESEQKYRLIAENANDIIAILNNRFEYEYYNAKVLEKTLGYSNNELLGKNALDYIHPEDLPKAKMRWSQGKISGEETEILRFRRKDGKYVWVEVKGTIFKLDEDSEKKALLIIRDITERIKVKKKLEASKKEYQELYEDAPIAYFSISPDKKILRCNDAASKLLGYSKDELLKMNVFDLYYDSSEGMEKAKQIFNRVFTGETIKDEYLEMKHKNGNPIWISLTVKPVFNPRGKTIEIRSIIIDITERKKAEEQLNEINRLKLDLLRRTSHELKTPLIAIKGYTSLILKLYEDNLEPELCMYLNEILNGCRRLEKLIKNILEAFSIESKKFELKKTRFNLHEFIKPIIRELFGLIKLRNHEINLNIDKEIFIYGDKDKLRDVFINLITNAIKYTPSGGLIEISALIQEKQCKILIKDNGIGLTNEEKSKLFTLFGKIERYGQGLDVLSDGTGLGLFLSKKIIELHDGKIWAESEGRNKGTRFYFTIPIEENLN